MPADKKTERPSPRPEKQEVRQQKQEESAEQKTNNEIQKPRIKRVNYIVKDLPIY